MTPTLRKAYLSLLLAAASLVAAAQTLTPVVRFHEGDNPYAPYADQFLSGFMQTAPDCPASGFLQMPFVGDPLLVYVGEKDSTQFMAYASGYEFRQRDLRAGRYEVFLQRYGICADLTAHPAFSTQISPFPDTTAEKGFLIDIDHATAASPAEDMDVVFIDKRTIRAYRRSPQPGGAAYFYYARFSHPFTTWNVRRERVTIENGEKHARCKVAFTFPLKPGERLTVNSAVSALSTNDAYALVEGHKPAKPFSDKFKPAQRPASDAAVRQTDSPAPRQPQPQQRPAASKQASSPRSNASRQPRPTAPASLPEHPVEISTRQATLRAAFYAAWAQVQQLPELKKAQGADEILFALSARYPAAEPAPTPAEADSLLRRSATALFGAQTGAAPTTEEAVWFIFNTLGLRPLDGGQRFALTRPRFNVATLHLRSGRRFVIYTKHNSGRAGRIDRPALGGQRLPEPYSVSRADIVRGGILDMKIIY